MKHTIRRTSAMIGTFAVAASMAAISPAQSTVLPPSTITVRSTDYTPASGQTFRLFGFVRSEGVPLPDATVRVKTFRHGEWVRLPGAVLLTHDDGHYRVRVILQMKGQRLLRVVANPKGDDIRNSHRDITVTVH
ncbi:MAG: hypothetical protein ACRDOW_01210 [Nocardioidaceae bacterium]